MELNEITVPVVYVVVFIDYGDENPKDEVLKKIKNVDITSITVVEQ